MSKSEIPFGAVLGRSIMPSSSYGSAFPVTCAEDGIVSESININDRAMMSVFFNRIILLFVFTYFMISISAELM